MYDQLPETWNINNRVNIMLLENISDKGLECTLSKRGGRNIALQFVHLHNLRVMRFENYFKHLLEGQSRIDPKKPVDRKMLITRLNESSIGMLSIIKDSLDNEGKVKGFKRGIIPLVGYMIAHEAHHRGSILLTLKQSGQPVDKEIRYGIWAWNQI